MGNSLIGQINRQVNTQGSLIGQINRPVSTNDWLYGHGMPRYYSGFTESYRLFGNGAPIVPISCLSKINVIHALINNTNLTEEQAEELWLSVETQEKVINRGTMPNYDGLFLFDAGGPSGCAEYPIRAGFGHILLRLDGAPEPPGEAYYLNVRVDKSVDLRT